MSDVLDRQPLWKKAGYAERDPAIVHEGKKQTARSMTWWLWDGQTGARTLDPRIKSPLLYQLSYLPIIFFVASTTELIIPDN